MRYLKTTLTVLALVVIASWVRPATAAENILLSEIDSNLLTSALYLDVIRSDALVTQQEIDKAAAVLVALAGLRNEFVAAEEASSPWQARLHVRVSEHDVLETSLARSRHRMSAANAAKTLSSLRQMRSAIKGMKTRLSAAEELRRTILAKLVLLSSNLEASLAWILRKCEYEGMLEAGTPLEDIEHAARNFSSSVVTDTRGKLRSVRTMFDRMAQKDHEAIAHGSKAYSRLARGARQFGKLLEEMLGTKDDVSKRYADG